MPLTIAALIAVAASAAEPPVPPIAAREAKVTEAHGRRLVDDYFWLRDRDDPRVIKYLEKENEYSAAMMRHTKALQETLYDEFVSRIEEDDATVPARRGDYFYYSRIDKGKQYRVHCRKRGGLDAAEEILLNENQLAEGAEYFSLGVFVVSPDHRLLAYSTDTEGSERFNLRFKDLESGGLLADEIPQTAYSVEWADDNATVYYTTRDETDRPYRLFRHRLGTSTEDDPLIYEESDTTFHMYVSKTNSKKYLLLELQSNASTEVRVLDAADPTSGLRIVCPRRPGVENYVEHHGQRFLIVTNDGAPNFRLLASGSVGRPATSAEPATTGAEFADWIELIPTREEVTLDSVQPFAKHLIFVERAGGNPRLRVQDLATGESHVVDLDEATYELSVGPNLEFDSDVVRFSYSSLTTPETVIDYNMNTREKTVRKQDRVRGGYDPARYETERILTRAADGTLVPISLVYKKPLKRDGRNPLILDGYGSYGSSNDPEFSSHLFSLLDRGCVFALAHVRGGSEMGRVWYENGKLLHKKNTFTDFIACAEHLIEQKYTAPDRLAIVGRSAGGLLIGAVVNMRPELFQAAVADVPFVDVINTMSDASIPLTTKEYDEWGNPNEKAYFDYMLSYSPYDNVRAAEYPHMLVLAGLNDTRVGYWEPAKWTAKLRRIKTGDNWLLLKTNMGAGHGGASGRYAWLRELAFEYAFLLDRLGVNSR